jgi:hypothetical protein
MQTEAPELTDLSKESKETLAMYGVDQTPTTISRANACSPAVSPKKAFVSSR